MKKTITSFKSIRLMIAFTTCTLLFSSNLIAQQFTSPTGSSSNVYPLADASNNRVQWLYIPSDFTPALPTIPQMITKLYLRVGSTPSSPTTVTFTNFKVSLGTTSLTTMTSGPWLTGLTQMINATSYTSSTPLVYNGWFEIVLPTPFTWNPSLGNLILEVSETSYSSSVYMYQNSSTGSRRLYGNVNGANGSSATGLVQLGIDVMPACGDVPASTLVVTNVTSNEVTLNWQPPTTGSIGYEYELSQNSVAPVSGTAISANTYTQSGLLPNTNYYFHVRNICTTGASYGWTTLPFSTLPCTTALEPLNVLGATTFCEGGFAELRVPVKVGATYTWYHSGVVIPGANAPMYSAFQTGSYKAQITAQGCSQMSDSVELNVFPKPQYNFTTNALDFCEGSHSVLSANPMQNYDYQWQVNNADIPGATSSTLTVNTTGTYRVLVASPDCTDTSIARTITKHALPTINIDGNNAPVLTAQPGFISYQWYVNGNYIANASSNQITATQYGLYTVTVVDSWSCSATSAGFQFGPSAINQVAQGNQVNVYPNPTNGKIYIKSAEKLNGVLFSVDGKEVLSTLNIQEMDLSALANGIYYLKLFSADRQLVNVEKIIKQSH